MRIIDTKPVNQQCCKCNDKATILVSHDGQTFAVCNAHKPTDLAMLRANDHIIKIRNKEYVLYSGLLDLAHRNGLQSMESEIIQQDIEKQFCLMKATVMGERGTFIAHGDASPDNTSKMVLSAFIRTCETRAYARCLRLFCGIGLTCAEELPPQS